MIFKPPVPKERPPSNVEVAVPLFFIIVETLSIGVENMVEAFKLGRVDVAELAEVNFPLNNESPVTFKALADNPPVANIPPPANVDVAVPEFLSIVETSKVGVVSIVETFN